MKTNILVQYSGGGYSGCIWEWNFFYIDKQGGFHDIFSSGCGGIDNLQDAQRLIDQDKTDTYIYDMDSEQDIKTFNKESNPIHIIGVLQWFDNYNDSEIEFFAVCSECGCKINNYDDCIPVENDNLLCQDCYFSGYCDCCECYVGNTEIVNVNPDEHYGCEYICTDCKEYHDQEREDQVLEDLRWQAFCTGTPDIFDLELVESEMDNRIEYPGQECFDF